MTQQNTNVPASQSVVNAAAGRRAQGVVTVTNAPTLVRPENGERMGLTLYNAGTGPLYHGTDNTVSVLTGGILPAGAALNDSLSKDAYYLIAASGSHDVRWSEVSRSAT